MCGIVGFIGKNVKIKHLINGLEKLEYRGYDSAGLSFIEDNNISIYKKEGKIKNLKEYVESILEKDIQNGIAHTRWATHGGVSDENSHPHTDQKKDIAIVHNGIIENFQILKKELIEKGHEFFSQTDTEVIAHLISENYSGNLFEAVYETKRRLEGTYALAVIHRLEPNKIIVARKGSPLVLANSKDFTMLASDITPLIKYTKYVNFLEDDEIAELNSEGYTIYDGNKQIIKRNEIHITWDETLAEKSGYDHFMEKEINEQPQSIKSALSGRIKNNLPNLVELENIKNFIKNDLKKIYIVACGTSYHAGLSMVYLLNAYSDLDINIEVASEFRYMNPHVDKNTLVIAVSQSGETIDTLEGIRIAKEKGAHILSMSNVVGSTIPRESNSVVYMNTGPEIGVAATKTYTAQIAILYLISAQILFYREQYSTEIKNIVSKLEKIDEIFEEVLTTKEHIKEISRQYVNYKNMMYVGRGFGYTAALEGALKLKEISYINATAYQAGELKHGPIALLDEAFPVFAIIPFNGLKEKMISNIMEIKARKARVIALTSSEDERIKEIVDDYILVPNIEEALLPLVVAPITQLFSYNISILRHLDPDKPRNLAKSVTVE